MEVVAQRCAAWHVVGVFNSSLRYRRLRRMSGLAVVILVAGGHASGGAVEGPYPGLPYHSQLGGGFVGVAQGGIAEAAKARQWARVPVQAAAAYAVSVNVPYPQPDIPLDRAARTQMTNYIYFVSPAGAQHNYGMSPRFVVRTVAFGAIPVEATLQLVQRRGADDLPVPLVVTASEVRYNNGPLEPGGPPRDAKNIQEDTLVEDAVTLRVARLVVDGVDLGLGERCQTGEPGRLSLLGKGWHRELGQVDAERPWLSGNYSPVGGGLMAGTVDVPAFRGCLTAAGEDVSRLLTSAVSGTNNALRLNVSGPDCIRPIPPATTGTGPPRPGETTPDAAGCPASRMPPEIPIP